MKALVYLSFVLVVVSCGGSSKSEADLLADIKKHEETANDPKSTQAEVDKARMSYIDALKSFYANYPENDEAPVCLDKLHMVYTNINDYLTATKYCDTLISNYPKYSNRALVLESAASAYDMSIVPRDTNKVKLYYNMLLKEFPEIDAQKRADIKKRVEYVKLTFEQFIQLQSIDTLSAL